MEAVLDGLGALSAGAWVCAGFALLAVLGLVRPPAGRLRRAGNDRLAGRVVTEAFDGPLAEDLGRVLALADLGVAEAEAWRSLAQHPQLGPAAADLSRSVESGTLMVQALGRHAAAAREARRTALVVRARSVGVRSVLPLMVCFIPAFLLLGVVPTVVSALVAALG